MTCHTEPESPPWSNDTVSEVCDRCGRRLNQRRNEDIWLSKVGVVLCAECHGVHKGIATYW